MKLASCPIERKSDVGGMADDSLEARVAALKNVVVFSDWPDSALIALAKQSQMKDVKANVPLQEIGQEMRSIHVLVSGGTQTGATDSQGRRVILKLHKPGYVHGLFLWASQTTRLRHDMVTLEPSRVLVIPRKALDEVVGAQPALWQSVAREASVRLLEALEQWMAFGLESARIRFARSILDNLAGVEGSPGAPTPQISMSQQIMADLLGISRQTVTSLVRDFEEQGLIRWKYGRISVLDLDALRKAAQFAWRRDEVPRSTEPHHN